MHSLLVPGEKIFLEDKPALTAFVIERQEVLLFVAGLAFLGFTVIMRWGLELSLIAFLAVDLILLHLVIQRLGDYYTRYVITNFRVIRVAGVVHHRHYSIPWVKITDFAWDQTLAGRLFGYATIRIESANEESKLKELRDLRDPVAFNDKFVAMIFYKQGYVKPPDSWPVLYEKLSEAELLASVDDGADE